MSDERDTKRRIFIDRLPVESMVPLAPHIGHVSEMKPLLTCGDIRDVEEAREVMEPYWSRCPEARDVTEP
ncbi:hypothetical protein E2C01_028490 [Portunus trituberculatus]|uniref:Uncharacterized protein n=1 Tax=Portunus trituberculatus TaxID=210409 RepID=A0A5B7EP94_PORTR|nr:hypothetical protein [Portunus trituberculatus]